MRELYPNPNIPNWSNAGRVHDWRNHISDPVRDIWFTFTEHQRVILAIEAQYRADSEEWE